MVGILVQLAISWLLAWLFVRKGLEVLGFYPTRKRLVQFVLFFIITALCCASGFIMKMVFAQQAWIINPALSFKLVLEGFWWNIKSVLFEELIFRGVILYILIRKIGVIKAIIFSAIAFGIYHWFSMNAFGNITQMTFLFFITGAMGLLLAYAYAKTFSLYIPIAIHFGWNLTQNFIFSSGPIGNGFFIQEIPGPFRTDSYFIFSSGPAGNGVFIQEIPGPFRTDSYLVYFSILFIPMLSVLLINFFLLKKMKQVQDIAPNNIHPVPATHE